jgi:hypothetical protein
MDTIDQILAQPEISDSLENYTYVEFNQLSNIPLGSHIKFIDRNENVKSGGFLINFLENPNRTKTYIILKSNLIYKLYPYYYWIFYKKPTHEPSFIKIIKKSNIGHLLETTTQPTQPTQPTQSIMNIVIKPKSKPKSKPKPKPKPKPNPTKRDIFKALLESLDNSK